MPIVHQIGKYIPKRANPLIHQLTFDCVLVILAYISATILRRILPLGKNVGTAYVWLDIRLYVTLVIGVFIGYALLIAIGLNRIPLTSVGRLSASTHSALLTTLMLELLFSAQSGLQKIYYALIILAVAVAKYLLVERSHRAFHR